MIKKEKLLTQLEKLDELEQALIPLMTRHLPSALNFSGLSLKDQEELLEFFQARAVVSSKHSQVLKEMISNIRGKDLNVF